MSGHPLAGLLWERQCEEAFLELGWEEVPNCECMFVHRKPGLFLSVFVDDIKMDGKNKNLAPMWKKMMKNVDIDEPASFLDHVYLGCIEFMQTEWNNHWTIYEDVWITHFCWSNKKLPGWQKTARTNCSVVRRHGMTCSKMRWTILWNGKEKKWSNFTKFHILVWVIINSNRKKSNLLENYQKFAHKLSWNACTWHELEDLTFYGQSTSLQDQSQSGLRHETDDQQARWISYIHQTNEYRQYCHVGNTAQHRRQGLFQDSDLAGDLEDSKSTSGGVLCIFGSRTFVPVSWMCEKQTSVSHGFTETKGISLDAGLRMDGLLALVLKESRRLIKCLMWTTCPPTRILLKVKISCTFFEDNEAVIKMIIKGRSPTMRHVSRTHRVALDWLFDRINLDPKIQIKYIDTKNQLVDILTKGNFTRDEWTHLLNLFNITHFSSTACTAAMAKRAQQGSGEERVTAKSRPMMNLTGRMPSVVSSSTSSSPGKRCYGNQDPLSLSQDRERTVSGAMSKRGQNTTSNGGSPTAQAHSSGDVQSMQRRNLVTKFQSGEWRWQKERWSSLRKLRQFRFELRSRIFPSESTREGYSSSTGNLGNRTKRKQKVRRTLLAQGNLMHHYQNSSTWNSQVIDTWQRSSNACKRNWEGLHLLRSQGSIQDKCIDTRNVHGVVDESIHLSWAGYPQEFEHLQKLKIREHWECVQHHSKDW